MRKMFLAVMILLALDRYAIAAVLVRNPAPAWPLVHCELMRETDNTEGSHPIRGTSLYFDINDRRVGASFRFQNFYYSMVASNERNRLFEGSEMGRIYLRARDRTRVETRIVGSANFLRLFYGEPAERRLDVVESGSHSPAAGVRIHISCRAISERELLLKTANENARRSFYPDIYE